LVAEPLSLLVALARPMSLLVLLSSQSSSSFALLLNCPWMKGDVFWFGVDQAAAR
jgi:hypothetical protein